MFSKLKKNYFLLISTFLILYFFFNLLDGERGLFSYFKKKEVLVNETLMEKLLEESRQLEIMTGRYNYVVDLLTEEQQRELRQW